MDTTAVSNLNAYGIDDSGYDISNGIIRNGDSFGFIMNGYGVGQNAQDSAMDASREYFDVRRIKAGNEYHAYCTPDDPPRLAYWLYDIDRMNTVIFCFKDSVCARLFRHDVSIVPQYSEVKIMNSLWQDTEAAGVSPLLALKLSDIYSWTIDFFGLRKGDSFRVIYDLVTCEGDTLDIGDVHYCDFIHDGENYECFRFEERGDTTGNLYWDSDGNSMRKAFLKAPLKFSRISSGFSYHRYHPVYHIYRPHTGIDYAAPKGTPVRSIGDGTVIKRGWGGGGGNVVKIRHNSVYTTAYMHLSRYGTGIRVGTRVRQGQVIGYVGATGTATGPHLDFRVWKNGSPINPLKLKSPPDKPIGDLEKQAFAACRDSLRAECRHIVALKSYERNIIAPLNSLNAM
ncbi:MAG: peptidoglycan DD-metalloendopeptidase family protein [Bacteroidales bacterium]|jgi:murein DD-endopeptidase MepM/ murein hydrolase activator NlpD|nr:peptidoglycan DD-metalloendopeptidase family protein [Bacteroidales bacterium]MCI2121992.1 peptidoglycan DD-metalloendopeptidase family protein [Bacteroidales bacterium]MCI2145577.1 peptidoglycan DD-metalloendopeptidase family protein [Bacteroidales bacterium]